jgi:hypothetical protein
MRFRESAIMHAQGKKAKQMHHGVVQNCKFPIGNLDQIQSANPYPEASHDCSGVSSGTAGRYLFHSEFISFPGVDAGHGFLPAPLGALDFVQDRRNAGGGGNLRNLNEMLFFLSREISGFKTIKRVYRRDSKLVTNVVQLVLKARDYTTAKARGEFCSLRAE